MRMLLAFFLTMNLWLLSIIIVKLSLTCFTVPWSVLLTLFAMTLLSSLVAHMYSWRCWKYLRHRPQRLRSFRSKVAVYGPERRYIVWGWLWLMAGSSVGITYMCHPPYWPWSTLGVLPAVIYTAACSRAEAAEGSSGSSDTASVSSEDEPESSEASNVNGDCADLEDAGSSGESARGAVS